MAHWCSAQGRTVGAILSAAQGWNLAYAWYHDRLDPAWQRRPPADTQALFTRLGLVGQFWQLIP